MKRVLLFLMLGSFLMASPKRGPSKRLDKVIVLDAGHGGIDLGAKANAPYCEEKRICLSTTLLTKKYLDQLGYKVVLTRSSDVYIPLPRRVKMAHPARASLFVSIHYNSSPNDTAQGIEIFYSDSKQEKPRAEASKKLAQSILTGLIKRTEAKSRGVKKGNFYVIREAKVPAVLIEGGFISNPSERGSLRKRAYLDKIARAIAEGIDQYFKGS